ncbi:MAG: hypothetical protein CO094_08600 [Anaerolineae bacterium CG_4_9_14_3_um_filter_57_17]|nr:MAG: hypothetical protein CO094_08600 [Anaerolineae bacterium CG_4_9_14_3_um_filter_57_17]
MKFRAVMALGFFLVGFSLLLLAAPAHAARGEPPNPTQIPFNPRLEKPSLPENPTLADQGAIPYWGICLSCHGDKGQGLTDEWREQFGEDKNCWTSKCHASNHPPLGFNLPHQVPALVGAGTLARFTTAQELKNYIQKTMPWWNPGSLNEEKSWTLTAYLLRENGALAKDQQFDIAQASISPVHLPIRERQSEFSGQGWLAVLLGLGLAGSLLFANNPIPRPAPGTRPSFLLHLHPPTIPAAQMRWRYTLGAGGLAVFLTLILAVTGALEMFFYIPTTQNAAQSVQIITFSVPFGALIRGLHFWAAQTLVIVGVVHLLRVVFTGAYNAQRKFNFLLGLLVFAILLLMNFSGYILRWDEGIHWALVVGANLLKTIPLAGEALYGFVIGGDSPGPATLTRFYTWHIFGLTLAALLFTGWHIFRVRRDGGISAPPEAGERLSRVELLRREILTMGLASLVLLVISIFFPAPLAAPIRDAAIPLGDIRAPWFFLWLQGLLRLGDAFWMGVGIPLVMAALMAALPYIFPALPAEQQGKWFPRAGRAAQVLAGTLILVWLVLTLLEGVR